ncbi:hypothetical protein I308_103305 [Cryptococcus tetragattii IND107]|uniref:Uncharacterized protein n=1 Tax=Cryptococcus tetragattii IND107 TaxID=1296105 RepID=A0ABR3BST4_9TREE
MTQRLRPVCHQKQDSKAERSEQWKIASIGQTHRIFEISSISEYIAWVLTGSLYINSNTYTNVLIYSTIMSFLVAGIAWPILLVGRIFDRGDQPQW